MLPRLDRRPRIVRSPVEVCFGTSPSQAPKSRPSAEGGSVANGGHHGAGDDRSHPWHTHQPLAGFIRRDERLDLVGDSIDALIQVMPVLHQAFDQVHHARREHIGAVGQDVRQRLPQRSQALSHRNAALEQKGADLVDHCRALAHQS